MINILIAEDDATTRRMLAQSLSGSGYHIFEAAEGIAAHSVIEKHNIHIAILDWILPGMTGIDICKKIRKNPQADYVFVIMLTIKDERKDLLDGFAAGVDEYIKKPVNLLELKARIKVGERIIGLEQSLKQKQKELFAINELKNKFIGMAAHDLKNPIISITGFSELLLKDPSILTEDQKEFLTIINTTSKGMLALLNDLLDISLIESGRMEIDPESGSLKNLTQDRIRINTPQAAKKQITIHDQLNEVKAIGFDPHRIGQAIDNLISNAIKFAPHGANVYLTLTQDVDKIKLCVRDEGPGIPEAEQHLLFNEFHRLSIRPTAGETSTGLGLAITKKIMEAHNGSIEFESRAGSGSTFCLIFPINQSTHEPTSF